MNTAKRAAAQFLLMLPALLFMCAVVLRNIQTLQPGAEQIVMWYAARMWTLWVLLLALPFTVFITGLAALFGRHSSAAELTQGSGGVLAATRADPTLRIVAALTLLAGVVLAIAVLHMGAN